MKGKNEMKQYFKKWICSILAFVMVLSTVTLSMPAKVEAASGILNVDTSVGWSLGGTSYGTEGLMTINGDVVYCLERLKTYYSGMTYTGSEDFSSLGFSSSMKEKLSLLAYYGSQRAKSTGNVDWYAVVGSAIWAETGQERGWILSPTFNTDAKVKSAIQTLQEDVAQYYVKPSFQGTATVKVGETIYLRDANDVLSTYTVKSTDGLSVKIDGDILAITGTSSAKDISTITFQKKISTSDVGVSIMYDAGDDVQKIGAFKVSSPISTSLNVNVERKGNLEITKKDNKGNLIPNTKFKISYNSDMSNPIGTYTTGSDGTVTISNLNSVNVYIQEVSVPDHLVLNDKIKRIGITSNNTAFYTVINDWKQGTIEVVKKDADTGKIIMKAGTVFEVYNAANVKVDTITTDATGVATSNLLDYGTYYVKEAKAPDKYTLQVEISGNVGVVENGKTYQITVSNKRVLGQITVEKRGEVLTDFKNGKFSYEERGLADATYNILAKENIMDPSNDGTVLYQKGSLMETITTGADGKATSSKLPLGIYEVVETEAPKGFVLNSERKTVELKYKDGNTSVVNESVTFINERQKVSIIASKQDSDTGEYLAGMEATIYANRDVYNYDGAIIVESGTALETVTTGADGKAAFTVDLPNDLTPSYVNPPINEGADDIDTGFNNMVVDGVKLVGNPNSLFVVKETKHPGGYAPMEVNYYIDTTYTNQNEKVLEFETSFYNDMTEVVISKQDATTGKEVPGATLELMDSDENLIESWVSAEEPHIIKGLIYGEEYILREIIAPEGYKIATEVKFIVGDHTKVIMEDAPILTDIRVNKVDSVTKEAILSKDFVFGLYSDKECTKLITTVHANTTDGTATFEDLRYGTYYIKEIEAPKGYQLSKEVKEIIINDDLEGVGEVHSFVYENILLPATTVNTGDNTFVLPLVVSLISALIGIGFIIMSKKKRLKGETKDVENCRVKMG